MNSLVSGYTRNGKAGKQRLADELREALEQGSAGRVSPEGAQEDRKVGDESDKLAPVVAMTLSAKLGIISALLLVSTFLPPYTNLRAPLNAAFYAISFILSVMAAYLGSKWWLVIPGLIVAGCIFALNIALHSY